ncbi:NUDIX hydrolase [Chitinophaga japonensis]|uniref:ADP-ribose pyrophosphatase YjhB (NUDIX family) n=1 Tax=Chitinophaga japonensis TaxID=104662 RepID=A0A562T7Z3_CHIJA|nr:NUDIX hydrolase [Chitinophaga japonensis]TWI89096.1 ADP-ribose pyrophosphatase YjhB (NUDIX family) [Chitinophaga japonensis]
MTRYSRQTRMLVAIDCIIFGFDGQDLKLLVIKRGFEPEKGKWSLMGGFVQPDEGFEQAASRILKVLTGLEGVYMEQLFAFGNPGRDPMERTISAAYFALIDINDYKQQLSDEYRAEWISLKKLPRLIFDHAEMVSMAQARLRYKAAIHPILFELLPQKFTIPQLQILYEAVYDTVFDKRNFSRKVLSTGLLIKQKDKERASSKRGAFYYKLDKRKYSAKFHAFLNFVADPGNLK